MSILLDVNRKYELEIVNFILVVFSINLIPSNLSIKSCTSIRFLFLPSGSEFSSYRVPCAQAPAHNAHECRKEIQN